MVKVKQTRESHIFSTLKYVGRYIDPSTKEPVVETQRYTRILEKVNPFSHEPPVLRADGCLGSTIPSAPDQYIR